MQPPQAAGGGAGPQPPGRVGKPYRVIVIGAGVSGLTAAWELERTLGKDVVVTVVEQSQRIGGWLRTERLGDAQIQVELGPRSFRSAGAGAYTLRLVEAVGALGDLVTPNKAVSGRRLVYMKGRLNLVTLSWAVWTVGCCALLRELLNLRRSPPEGDETIESFVRRRFGSRAVPVFQAVCNGIFAGPISRLSVGSCFPVFVGMERRSRSLVRHGLLGWARRADPPETPLGPELLRLQRQSTLYSFRQGMEHLPRAIRAALGPGCKLRSGVTVSALLPGPRVVLTTSAGEEMVEADFVISTIAPCHLAPMVRRLAETAVKRHRRFERGGGARMLRDRPFPSGFTVPAGALARVTAVSAKGVVEVCYEGVRFDLREGDAEPCGDSPQVKALGAAAADLAGISHASVTLVTLAGPRAAFKIPKRHEGFGFLVCDGDMLGCTFDALTFPVHHEGRPGPDEQQPQVLTAMLGGDHDPIRERGGADWMQRTDLIEQAVVGLLRYADVRVDTACPGLVLQQTVARDGIPQYAVGHAALMASVTRALSAERIAVAGMAVRGVGVNDCIASGLSAASQALAAYGRVTGRSTPASAWDADSAEQLRLAAEDAAAASAAAPRRLRGIVCCGLAAAAGGSAVAACGAGAYIAASVYSIRRAHP
eukprot:TRINITY_DN32762_c0_g1_i1.p1 TRINITY_DN32762_c0_g1~~TRINITY_DN32762_c0_g1_i1.p1  ORF type:complete len:651 (+),score=181.98 TRINITY_DN32762_c0_g1_i1:62-2014(+)